MISKNKIIILLGVLLIVGIAVVLIIVFTGGQKTGGGVQPVPAPGGILTMWGVFDDAKAFETTFAAAGARTGIAINYIQKDPSIYENELVNAMAAGRGPDIFMFHNTWLQKHYDKIVPMPPSFFDMQTFSRLFPVVVQQDFAPQGTVFALPLSIDTLALFYNKDIFEQTVTPKPPVTWNDFLEDTAKMRVIDSLNSAKIIKAGAAIGGSAKSVSKASDILNLLMMQAGTIMTDGKGASFAQSGSGESSGLKSLDFYAQFANPSSRYYTWNDGFSNSLDAFAQGKAAMMIDYAFQIPFIREKNPFLNFAVAQAPQPVNREKDANYANYWGFAVSKASRNPVGAWNFIVNLTTAPDIAKIYIEEAGKPPALLDLIPAYENHPKLGVFTRQILTARSWPQPDSEKVKTIFSEMIESVLTGQSSSQDAIVKAEEQVTALMGR
ncbi:MAG: extracellular solute-binding protein [Candidatus Brennerbacteria bacterium]|nr:extracellular solute-binding protein [Candidatus Brennerbacteria bacterium]